MGLASSLTNGMNQRYVTKDLNKEFSTIFQLCQHNESHCIQQEASLKHNPELSQSNLLS